MNGGDVVVTKLAQHEPRRLEDDGLGHVPPPLTPGGPPR
jgi:hypothetical protein